MIYYMYYNKLLSRKPKESYSTELNDIIMLLTFDKEPKVVGSQSLRVITFPSDIDLMETYIKCCSIDDLLNKLTISIKETIKRISKEKDYYISEFKIGEDERYKINIGTLSNNIFNMNKKEVKDKSDILFTYGLLDDEEMQIIEEILNKSNPTANDHDILHSIFYNHMTLRWDKNELLRGYKILPFDEKITIREALNYKNVIKLDIIVKMNERYIEVTNFLILAYEDKQGNIKVYNAKENILNSEILKKYMDKALREDIEKMAYSKFYYSIFKASKRMFVLAMQRKDNKMINKLLPIITSDISLLYQIKSDLETILNILEKVKDPPKVSIKKELDNMKNRLTYIIEIPTETEIKYDNIIDKINKSPKEEQIYMIKDLKKELMNIINIEAMKMLKNHNLYPIPRDYLPDKLKYLSE